MTVPLNLLDVSSNGMIYLFTNLSRQEVFAPTPPPVVRPQAPWSVPPPPSPKNLQLKELEMIFADSTYHDIFFVFDAPLTHSFSQHGAPTTSSIGTHKLVLSQCPYFQRMFESGFSQGGSGGKRIHAHDTKAATFKLLLWYLYTENHPHGAQSSNVYINALQSADEVSWEELYLAADRYEFDGLRQYALRHLFTGASSEGVIPYLFRTAYLFEELRQPMVKYGTVTCGAEISKKSV